MINNIDGMRAVVDQVIALGHRRIAYLGAVNGYQTDTERFAAYREALQAAKIPVSGELVVHGDGMPGTAKEVTERLLALDERPTAICCYNDMTALGAMRAIRARGLKIPEDVSVTGFDDLFFSAYTEPPLTTVRQPMRRMGQLAMESLTNLMEGRQAGRQVWVEPELVVRGSICRVG